MSGMDLSSSGLDQMKLKIQQLTKEFSTGNGAGVDSDVNKSLSEIDKVKGEFDVTFEDPTPKEEIPMEFDFGITDADLEKLLPGDGWFDSIMPDFKDFFDFK